MWGEPIFCLMSQLTHTPPPPDLPKKGKKGKPNVCQKPLHKVETERFYRAQCIHYGLKLDSDKDATKDALLVYAKANAGRFVVPTAVADIKKEARRGL